ncbi:MAG: competence/damage-inducible protein A [Anaerolineae bacterium]|nr:competence/damage-inducible protein A [Anaerolineae bacterium]
MTQAEIIAVGNEVLSGDVVDTNSNWLARQVTRRGGRVARITTIPDTVDIIAQAVRDAVARRADLILVTGGLGPTADDLTLAGIAAGLGRNLTEDAAALGMVARRYAELAARGYVQPGLTDARRKMAVLPQGSRPLWNSIGGAPGVRVDVEDATIVALPGVPEEMKAIFLESLTDLWAERLPLAYAERAGLAQVQDDSLLAPHHRAVSAAFPNVYIKTRVQAFGMADTILVTFAASASTAAEAQARVDAAFDALRDLLAAADIAFVGA